MLRDGASFKAPLEAVPQWRTRKDKAVFCPLTVVRLTLLHGTLLE